MAALSSATEELLTAKLIRNRDGSPLIIANDGEKYVFESAEKRFIIDVASVNIQGKYDIHTYTSQEGDVCNVLLDMDESYSSLSTTETRDIQEEWTDASTKFLLATFDEKRNLLQQRKIKNKKMMFQAIAEALQKKGYYFTAQQVSNKWKTLERAYKNKVDNNAKSGRGRKTCPYEVELEAILGHQHNIIPEITLGTATITTRVDVPSTSQENTSFSEDVEDIVDNGEHSTDVQHVGPSRQPPAKKRRVKAPRDVQLILQELKEDRQARVQIAEEQNRIENIKIELFQRILEKL